MKTTLLWLLMAGTLPVAAQNTCSTALSVITGEHQATHPTENADVWYKFTPSTHVRVTLSTLGLTTLDTYVLVYTECGSINYIAFNDNNSNSLQSHLTFEGKAGITYYIRWKYNSTLLNTPYKWKLSTSDPVPGDFCSNAKLATSSNTCTHIGGNDQWFTYTATDNYYLIISTDVTPTIDTKCFVTSGCETFYYELNHFKAGNQSKYALNVDKGKQYLIRWEYPSVDATYSWQLSEGAINRGNICSLPHTAAQGTNHAEHADKFAEWYTYTAVMDGTIVLSTQMLTDVDTKVEVFESCSPLEYVRRNDDYNSNIQSYTEFSATAGKTYRIKWNNPASLNHAYNWSLVESGTGAGTSCSNALNAVVGNNRCIHVGGDDQWFKYIPLKSGLVTLSTSELSDVIVYSDCGVTDIATGQGITEFNSIVGNEYYLRFKNPATVLEYNWTISVVYDAEGVSCGNPLVASKGSNTALFNATTNSLWYSYTAQEKSVVTIGCEQINQQPGLTVYSSCGTELKSTINPIISPVNIAMEEGDRIIINWNGASESLNWTIGYSIILDNELKERTQGMSISPNPTQGNFTLSGIPSQGASIKIFALDGTMVYSDQTTNSPDSVVPGEFLPKGIYLVLVITNERTSKFKLLKQ